MNVVVDLLLSCPWKEPAQLEFPAESCVNQNKLEPDVYDSDETFLCVVMDERFPDRAWLRKLNPYVYIGKDEDDAESTDSKFYGWTDGHNVYDHCTRAIHGDSEKVVLWQKV